MHERGGRQMKVGSLAKWVEVNLRGNSKLYTTKWESEQQDTQKVAKQEIFEATKEEIHNLIISFEPSNQSILLLIQLL